MIPRSAVGPWLARARHVSDRCETPSSCSKKDHSRDRPADRRYGSTRTLRYEKGFEILSAEAEIGEGGILADGGMLDAGEIRRENMDRA
jgi:hypothetical protein